MKLKIKDHVDIRKIENNIRIDSFTDINQGIDMYFDNDQWILQVNLVNCLALKNRDR